MKKSETGWKYEFVSGGRLSGFLLSNRLNLIGQNRRVQSYHRYGNVSYKGEMGKFLVTQRKSAFLKKSAEKRCEPRSYEEWGDDVMGKKKIFRNVFRERGLKELLATRDNDYDNE